jgi:hypothetical protein
MTFCSSSSIASRDSSSQGPRRRIERTTARAERCSSYSIQHVALKVEDVAPNGYAVARATVRQKKTGRPVRFELTEQTRQAVDADLKTAGKKPGEFLFTRRRSPEEAMTTRQYARLVSEWVTGIGVDASVFGTKCGGGIEVVLIVGHPTEHEHFPAALNPLRV